MRLIQFESLARYKYRLLADLVLQCSVRGFYLRTAYIELRSDGGLTLRAGYAWDGPSGPTIDTARYWSILPVLCRSMRCSTGWPLS